MREIFKPATPPAEPGRVFYTIATEDAGTATIETEIGPICLSGWFGIVRKGDVGKRLHRTPVNGGISGQLVTWVWQVENEAQRDARLARTPAQAGRDYDERFQAQVTEAARQSLAHQRTYRAGSGRAVTIGEQD
jgi:hypothetical protein